MFLTGAENVQKTTRGQNRIVSSAYIQLEIN